MRKRIAFLTLFLIMLCGYAAHTHVMSAFFEWSLKKYCLSNLNGQLTYSQIGHDGNKWVLERPALISLIPLAEGGYHVAAQSTAIEASFSWDAGPLISLDVALVTPEIDIGNGAQTFKDILTTSKKTSSFLNVHTNLIASEGIARVHAPLEPNDIPLEPVFFNINIRDGVDKKGEAKFHFGKEASHGYLQVLLEEKKGSTQFDVQLHKMDCEPLMKLVKNTFPDWTVCDLTAGHLTGQIQVIAPHKRNPYAQGNAVIRNLAFCHPTYAANFEIPELTIQLAPQNTTDGKEVTVGRVDLSRSSTIAFEKEGKKCWAVEALGGGCSFQGLNNLEIDLEAMCKHDGDSRLLRLEGSFDGLASGQYALKGDCRLHEEESENDTIIHVITTGNDSEWQKVVLECTHLTKSEIDFIQNIIKKTRFQLPSCDFNEGAIDIALQVALADSKASRISVENFTTHRLDLAVPESWNFAAKQASGSLFIDLTSSDPIKTLLADLKVEDARFTTPPEEVNTENGAQSCSCCLSDLHGQLAVKEGEFAKSYVSGNFMGLKGTLEIDDSSVEDIVKFECEGDLKTLCKSLPEILSQRMSKNFSDESLKVSGKIQHKPLDQTQALQVTGKAVLSHPIQGNNQMTFGVNLNKISEVYQDNKTLGCWWSFARSCVNDGWFDAEQVPLEKFVSPFIFQQDQIHLSGKGVFHGTFNDQGIELLYDAHDVVMENADFCVEIKSISPADASKQQPCMPAKYFVDFTDMSGKGSVPIYEGTYFEKNSGLLFTEVNSIFEHKDGFGYMPEVEAFCNGIYFKGQIDLDWSQPGPGIFDVDIKANEMLGKMSQMQQLCSHFNKPLFFLKIPLEGDIAFRNPGSHLHFAFKDGDYNLDAKINGALADGVLKCPNADMIFQEIGLNFSYDHLGNNLDFSDIQGTLLVGKPNHVEEYDVVGESIHFTDYANDEADFDIWVGDKKRDILRLAGKTRKVLRGSDGEPMLSIMLDHSLSHFGDVYPSVFQLTLKDWSQIESLKLVLDLQIKTLLSDLQRFSRTGLMFLSRSLLRGLNNLKTAEGGFNVDLSYDGERSLLTYELSGNDIAIGKHKFKKLLLNGNKKNNTWSIEQLQLDEISLAADLLKDDKEWKVNFLGARIGDALLAGLEGQYLDDTGKLMAKINLLEVDLSKLQGWPALKNAVEEFTLAGQLRATGSLNAELNPDAPKGMSVEIDLETSLHGGIVQGLRFQDIENAGLYYKTGAGLALKNIRTALKAIDDDSVQAGIYLQKVDCNFANRELIIDKLFFRIPSQNIEKLTDNLERSFPSIFKASIAEIARSLKYKDGRHGEIQGALTFELSEPHCALRLSLNDGIYELMGKEHDVRGFVLEYDPFELKISAIYKLQQEWLSATIRSTAPNLDSGELVVLDNPHLDPALQEYFRGGFKPLTVRWQIDPQYGFYIHKLEGRLRGLQLDLMREPSLPLDENNLYLTGIMQINMREAHVLLDPDLSEDLRSWEVGNGYSLHGLWTLDKNSEKPFSKSLSFHGDLLGKEFEFFGYQFNNLSARASYERGFIHMQNILLSDACGNMHIAESVCTPMREDVYELKVPFMALSNFKPGLLRAIDGSQSTVGRSLNIRQLEIQDINGIVGDRNTFKGRGRLAFVNPPRKNIQPTIFAIPAELLTRIGLDLAVLTPVRGAIYYQIENGKVMFTKFKDIYSKGRLSKFYLPNNDYQSSVDFDGNLDMQIRMKQYNLVFKLAELFTVNVQGSLSKPSYSLNKQ